MKRAFSLIIIMCWVFAACQPTPDKEIVQSKNSGKMLEIINESNEKDIIPNYKHPEHLEKSIDYSEKNLYININADIETQNLNKFSVWTIKPSDITQQEADEIISVLIGDEPIWATNIGAEVLTKEYQTEVILFLKKN